MADAKIEVGDGLIYDHRNDSCWFKCFRGLCCSLWTSTRIEKQRLVREKTKCYYCCWKTQVTQIDMDQVDDIQLRRHMFLWCCFTRCFDPGIIRMWGKDEDDGIDPSYVDLGLFVNSEKVFEDWSNVLCTGGDNELRAIHESSKR